MIPLWATKQTLNLLKIRLGVFHLHQTSPIPCQPRVNKIHGTCCFNHLIDNRKRNRLVSSMHRNWSTKKQCSPNRITRVANVDCCTSPIPSQASTLQRI